MFRLFQAAVLVPRSSAASNAQRCRRIPLVLLLLASWFAFSAATNHTLIDSEELLDQFAHIACASENTTEGLEECLGLPVTSEDDEMDVKLDNSTDIAFAASKFPPRGKLKWKINWKGGSSGPKYAKHRQVILDALGVWSDLITDSITLNIEIEPQRKQGSAIGAAYGNQEKMPLVGFVKNSLEPKLQMMLKNKHYKFPDA
eukprot:TRINITY_DN9744_c0_g1_i1.p1 TRINITY_DN9744_c0_g1~~TRINITY_DN9744_c0_g1_i1.p1  ORF type:complete len:201 (-),score=22.11 TRINITY_DN9744_c0_g1_i1:65-667(-)